VPDEVAPEEPVPSDEVVGGDDVVDAEVVPVEPVPVEPVDSGYTQSGVPTFDSVREKIETRYGTSIGAAELAAETPEGRTVEQQYDARQRAAVARLEQIRASMHDDKTDHEPGQT
jgi:hypothetical protein